MKNTPLEIEVIEHVSDEYVYPLATESCETLDEVMECVSQWIEGVDSVSIESYLNDAYGQGEEAEEQYPEESGITINVKLPNDGELLVQIQIPFKYGFGLLKDEITIEDWYESNLSTKLSEQLIDKHSKK